MEVYPRQDGVLILEEYKKGSFEIYSDSFNNFVLSSKEHQTLSRLIRLTTL